MYRVSYYFQYLPYNDSTTIIWHSVFGNPMLVTRELADKLCAMRGTIFELEDLFDPNCEADEVQENAGMLLNAHFLIENLNEEIKNVDSLHKKYDHSGQNKVKALSLIMSEECQFRCKYCIHFANSKHRYNPEKFMSYDVAIKSINQYIDLALKNNLGEAYINFGGGEPLLNWPTIAKLLPEIDKLKSRIPIKLGINTNLALLTPQIARTLINYDVFIAASLDGTKSGNDAVRLTKNLKGTYDKIIKGFDILAELGHPLDGFAMTVTEDNFQDIDTPVIDWAAAHHMTEVRIDIDVVGMVNIPVKNIVSSLTKVRCYAREKGISVIGFWSRPVENMGLDPETEDIGFCGGERGNSLCVAPSGQVFPCGYSNYQLGYYSEIEHIHQNIAYKKLLKKRSLIALEQECGDCEILGFCRGGCMITNEANCSPDKRQRMCELYRVMTREILRESVALELST